MASAVARAMSALALVLVATYYLLASIPFSYYHFLQFPHFWWLPLFIRIHPFVLAGALAGVLPRGRHVPEDLRPWIRYVAIAGATVILCMFGVAWRPAALSYELAAALTFVPLGLLIAANSLALAAGKGRPADSPERAATLRGVLSAGVLTGALASAVYLLLAIQRGAMLNLKPSELAAGSVASIFAHIGFFCFVSLVVISVRAIASRQGWPPSVERLAVAGFVAVILAVVIRRSLLTALVLDDVRAAAVAVAVAIAVVMSWMASVPNAPVSRDSGVRWSAIGLSALALVICVGLLPRMLLLADWGGSLQKVLVLSAWTALGVLVTAVPLSLGRRTVVGAALCIGMVAVAATTAAFAARARNTVVSVEEPTLDLGLAVDRYATFDTSLTVLLDVFRPMISDTQFYSTLRREGDATDDRSLPATPLRIVDRVEAHRAHRPNIFIIVIDSLRPDYLSAYNSVVPFTPAIGAFAKESIVMRRAFTQYAGTALSQPVIWAGGLIQRAMYVKPFAAVNNLERLVAANDYRRYISVDEILSVILEDWRGVTRLDAHLAHPDRRDQMFKFDLCSTLAELTDRLDRDPNAGPLFFYSQPQNLHIRVLAGDAYPQTGDRMRVGSTDFFRPAADTLSRIDACFGKLIDYLKTRGLYDDSIVVLTSDHGDSYGEAGRWAHAFYMAPETMRIPLILHVPEKYRQDRTWDPDGLALLTDVTPTLYDLLDYQPLTVSDLLGRTLMPRTGSRNPPRHEFTLIQSSYSRVFGLLDLGARWMYVADANHGREQLFDLSSDDPYPRPIGTAERLVYRKHLLDRIERLNEFYTHRQ
jgi:hypothetical protein